MSTPTNSIAQEWKKPEKTVTGTGLFPRRLWKREGGPGEKQDLGFRKGCDVGCLASKASGGSLACICCPGPEMSMVREV